MAAPATLDHLRLYVTGAARKIGRKFTSPSDDWIQVAFVQMPEGIEMVVLPNELFKTGVSKELLGEFLRRFVSRGAYRYAVLLNAHMATTPTPEQVEAVQAERLRIEQIEGSREQLILLVGDAEEEQVWMAPIERRPGTAIRLMGAWERTDETTGWAFEGRFVGLNAYMRQQKPADG